MNIFPSILTSNLFKHRPEGFLIVVTWQSRATAGATSSFLKIAKIKVLNSSNPAFAMNGIQLSTILQSYFNQNKVKLRSLSEIQIDNNNGLSRYEIVNDIITLIP